VVVWEHIEPPHCKAEEEARERQQLRQGDPTAPVYVMAGPVEDFRLLKYDLHPDRPAGSSSAATDLLQTYLVLHGSMGGQIGRGPP